MSSKTAKYVEYDGALYQLKVAGGLGTTRPETNISLFDEDFDSEGELQYSGTPDGGQFIFEARVKFPDGMMLPVSLPVDEDTAIEIVHKMAGGRPHHEAFPDKWKSQLPSSFLERLQSKQKSLSEGTQPKELPAPTVGSVADAPKEITATLHPWRTIPETTVAQILIKFGAYGADRQQVEVLGGRVQRALMRRYRSASVSVRVDGAIESEHASINVWTADSKSTCEHDDRITRIVSDIWEQMHLQ